MPDEFTRTLGRTVPQTEQADPLQVANAGGGFSFTVTPLVKLERFLILGSEGGTYYYSEKDLTKQNLDNLAALTRTDPKLVVDKAVEISASGRSYKNNAAIFALAYVMSNAADDEARSYARINSLAVLRTTTHLFLFEKYLKLLASPQTGFGTSRNRAVAAWYETKDRNDLAYQVVKYRQREGWTHRDSMRQARPVGVDSALGAWILGKPVDSSELPAIVQGFERVQTAVNIQEVLDTLDAFPNLPWETIPTEYLKNADLWKKLFYNGQLKGQALVRNITRLARIMAFNDLQFAADYAKALQDKEMIRKTKLHPINFLNALVVHQDGQVQRNNTNTYSWSSSASRKKDWITSPVIIDALNAGYHLAFETVEPSNKRTLLGVDVSGSMSSAMSLGLDLTAAQVSGAMASAIARVEPNYQIMGFANTFRDLGITANMDLNTVMQRVQDRNFGNTDCSLPMRWAKDNNVAIDTFVVITDSETNSWSGHPHKELQNYRQRTGIDARLIVVGVCASDFTIADPNDAGMLDVAGADSNLPKLVSEFSKGQI